MCREENSFLHDRCGNVHENKGALWKSGAEQGMSLKISQLFFQAGNVLENRQVK
jgi:hypothetical protein